jgi:hypothetical protein
MDDCVGGQDETVDGLRARLAGVEGQLEGKRRMVADLSAGAAALAGPVRRRFVSIWRPFGIGLAIGCGLILSAAGVLFLFS